MPVYYIDGGSLGNEQKTKARSARIAIAYSESSDFIDPSKIRVYSELIGDKTNNEAEYEALLGALSLIAKSTNDRQDELSGPGKISLIRSDSKLIVNQTNGEWRVNEPKLISLNQRAKHLIKELGNVRLEWIPRNQNYAGLWIEGRVHPFSVEKIAL